MAIPPIKYVVKSDIIQSYTLHDRLVSNLQRLNFASISYEVFINGKIKICENPEIPKLLSLNISQLGRVYGSSKFVLIDDPNVIYNFLKYEKTIDTFIFSGVSMVQGKPSNKISRYVKSNANLKGHIF